MSILPSFFHKNSRLWTALKNPHKNVSSFCLVFAFLFGNSAASFAVPSYSYTGQPDALAGCQGVIAGWNASYGGAANGHNGTPVIVSAECVLTSGYFVGYYNWYTLNYVWQMPDQSIIGGEWAWYVYPGNTLKNTGNGSGCDGGEGGGKSCGVANGAPMAGDPINVATGNKYLEEQDYSVSSWLTFRRFYNSNGGVAKSTLGTQWRHIFDRSLKVLIIPNQPTSVTVLRPDGKQEIFRKSGTTWITDSDVPDTLTSVYDPQGVLVGYKLFVSAKKRYETYNSFGVLQGVADQTGLGINLAYSTTQTDPLIAPKADLLLSVIDSQGRALNFSYDALGRIIHLTLPDASQINYSYDSATGDLNSVQYPDGHTRQYVYNEAAFTSGANLPHRLTGVIDENGGRYEDTMYDSSGRGILARNANGVNAVQITYNASGTSTVQYASGTQSIFTLLTTQNLKKVASLNQPCSPACDQDWKTRSYDSFGYPATFTDFNNIQTQTTYSSVGLLTQKVEAVGTSSQRTSNFTWDTNLRVPLSRTVLNAQGGTVKKEGWVYNRSGQAIASCSIDPALASSYVCVATGTVPAGVRRSVYAYCTSGGTTQCPISGLLLTIDGPRTDVSDVTTYTYYSSASSTAGSVHSVGDLATVTNALGQLTSITNYDLNGRPLSITDANGIVTTLTYTPRGWLKTKTINNTQTTTYDYDGVGQLTKVTQPDGSYLSYTYDTAHRLTDITDNSGNKIHYTLDAMSNRTKEETFDPSNVLKKSRSKVYDSLNRLQKDIGGTNPSVQITQYGYDNNGNLKTTTDPLSRVTSNNYDGLNRLVQITDPNSGVAQKGYNPLDQVSSVTDPRSLITQYTNDALGNLKQLQSPDSGITTNVYDAAGNITQKTDARGVVTNYSYDALNRVTAITYPTSSSENVTFAYDDTTNGNKGKGRLTGYSTTSTATSFIYDSYGNVTQQSDLLSPSIYTTGYQYNSANRVTQVTYPSGRIVTYTRNSLGQITQVQTQTDSNASPVTIISNAGYMPFGPINSLIFGNGIASSLTYDLDYRVSRITTSSNPVWDFGYSYDAGSHITGIADQVGSLNKTYGYDSLYRVTTDTNPAGTWNYAFDANSNRTGYTWWKPDTTTATQTATISATSNRLTQLNGGSVSTDSAGNLLSQGNKGYTYNNANRLSTYSESGVLKATYGYNAQNQRTVKQATRLTHYHYGLDGKTLATTEYNTDGSLYQRIEYLWLDDTPVVQVRTDYVNNAVSATRLTYIHADHLNTPRAMTDSTQAIVWRWDSDAFGFVPPNNDPDGNLQTDNLALRFPGQLLDADTGLNINGFREYDASLGRYTLQSDPIGLRGKSWSTYAYANGNPISRIDPLGLWSASGSIFDGGGIAIIFGKDKCGKFATVRIGIGLGGGYSYDPNGTRPGGDDDCSCGKNGGPASGGITGGLYGEGSIAGPWFSASGGVEGGAQNNNDGSGGFYGGPTGGLSLPGTGSGNGIRLEGSAGAEFSFGKKN